MVSKINVLDKGYVILHDHMGTDLTVVNSARVSFNKKKTDIDQKDINLLNYLLKHDHTSPFRHATLQFEIKAPLMVCRQIWKYIVGSDHTLDAWNEVSRRYVEEEPEFYIPKFWRKASSTNKQGSVLEPVKLNQFFKDKYDLVLRTAITNYKNALESGIAPELARSFLPANVMYTSWYWTCSLQSLLHFLNQRIKEDAQYESREYAKAIKKLARPLFLEVFRAYDNTRSKS